MKDLITKLAEKYSFDTINQRVVALANAPTIRIGFIGEFSAGKTSLINSILGINLPTNIAPTTKALCLIEPTIGLERNKYFKEDNNLRETIDFNTFRSILRGETDTQAAVVQVPPCEVLPSGCIFVDTPGIHTAVGDEAELTKAYLSMLDAAVVCINITNGVINKDLLDFLCDKKLTHLQKHLVFALTWSDRKSPDEGEIVRSSIVKLLEKTVQEGRMEMSNLNEKVFTISAMEKGNAEKLYGVLKKAVLEDLPALHEQRKQQMLCGIGQDLAGLLEERLKVAKYDQSELDTELEKTQKELNALQNELRKREEKMDVLEENVTTDVKNVLSNYIPSISRVENDSERETLIDRMNDEVTILLQKKAEQYLGLTNFTASGLGSIGDEIQRKMKSIDSYKDIAVTIATSIATAWIIPGGAVAGNAAQAAGGAAARGAANAAAKTAASAAGKAAASTAAKTAAKVAAKTAATTVASQTLGGTLTQVLGGVGAALKAINPLEHIGSMVASSVKKNALEALITEKASSITASFILSLETPFETEILQPIMDNITEKRNQLSTLQDKGMEAFEAFRKQQTETKQELSQLKSMLA